MAKSKIGTQDDFPRGQVKACKVAGMDLAVYALNDGYYAEWIRSLRTTGSDPEMIIQYFSSIPLIDLIRRDQGRVNSVGGAVLREQLQRLQPEEHYWRAVESKHTSQ